MLAWHRAKLACPPCTGIRFTANIRRTTHHQAWTFAGAWPSTFPFCSSLGSRTHTTYRFLFFSFLFFFFSLFFRAPELATEGSIKERGTRLLSKAAERERSRHRSCTRSWCFCSFDGSCWVSPSGGTFHVLGQRFVFREVFNRVTRIFAW